MNLNDEIEKYKREDGEHLHRIRKYYEKLNHSEVISQAALAQTPNKRGDAIVMNSHQCRIGITTCKKGLKKLETASRLILKCQRFEEIFKHTEDVIEYALGLGDLWSYDTALRIGFHLRRYPKEVYIHRGVVKGIHKLGEEMVKKAKGKRSLPLSAFPKALWVLKPYELENFLCVWGSDGKGVC